MCLPLQEHLSNFFGMIMPATFIISKFQHIFLSIFNVEYFQETIS